MSRRTVDRLLKEEIECVELISEQKNNFKKTSSFFGCKNINKNTLFSLRFPKGVKLLSFLCE